MAVAWDSLRMMVKGYRRNTEALHSERSKRARLGVQGASGRRSLSTTKTLDMWLALKLAIRY